MLSIAVRYARKPFGGYGRRKYILSPVYEKVYDKYDYFLISRIFAVTFHGVGIYHIKINNRALSGKILGKFHPDAGNRRQARPDVPAPGSKKFHYFAG